MSVFNNSKGECGATHPKTGDACSLKMVHNFANDARDKQHLAPNGVKWPHLHVLDPSEGFNGPLPQRF